MNVFISYARADGEPLALRLRDDLGRASHEAWYDQTSIPGGADWSRVIESAIDRCDCLVAVLTAGAFESAICRGEHLRALRRRKRLIPILAQAGADRPLYLEAANFLEFTDPARYGDSLSSLFDAIEKGEGSLLDDLDPRYRTPNVFAVRPLPAGYVERPEELDSLCQAVLAGGKGGLIAVHGIPGGGKTTLALSLCHLPRIQDSFPDGVIWLDIGRGRSEQSLVEAIALVGTSLGDAPARYRTVKDSAARIRSALHRKAVLLVLDDVWDLAHVEAFRSAAPKVRVLYTTRDETVPLFLGGHSERLGPMSVPVAARMLESMAGRQDVAIGEIAESLGGLPIALKLVGAMLREGLRTEQWDTVFKTFSDLKLGRRARGRDVNVRDCFDWSLDVLAAPDQRLFNALGVFSEGTPIPSAVVSRLWRSLDLSFRESDCLSLLTDLKRLALIEHSATCDISLHDLMLEYARENLGSTEASVHQALLASYREGDRPWREVEADGYIYAQVAHHLDGAGARDELRALLLDSGWLEAKLRTSGLPSLISDYDRFAEDEELRLVQRALRLGANALFESPGELPAQLVGRLGHRGEVGITKLLADALERREVTWLRPVRTTLALPDDILRAVIGGNLTVALSQDGTRAVVDDGARVQVWDVPYGVVTATLDGHTDEVLAVAFSGDGRYLLSGARDGTVRLWDVFRGGEPSFVSSAQGGEVTAVSIGPDGALGVSLTDGTVTVWDLRSPGPLHTIRPADGARCVDIDETGKVVLTGGNDGVARLWNVEDGGQISELSAFPVPVTAGRIAASVQRCVLGSLKGELSVWDLESESSCSLGVSSGTSAHRAEVTFIALTADGRYALSSSLRSYSTWDFESPPPAPDTVDESVRFWDVSEGKLIRGLPHRSNAYSVALTGDGRVGASSGHDVRVWDLGRAEEQPVSETRDRFAKCVAVSPDSRLAAVATTDSHVELWSVTEGAPRGGPLLMPEFEDADVLTFDDDGKRLTAISHSGLIRGWAVDTLSAVQEHRPFAEAEGSGHHACFLHDHRYALFSSRDGVMPYWDLLAGVEVFRLEGPAEHPRGVRFAHDGSRAVALYAGDRSLWVWDLRAPESPFRLDLGDAFPSREQLASAFDEPVDEEYREFLSRRALWDLAASADARRAVCTIEYGPIVLSDLERRESSVIETDLERNPAVFLLSDGMHALTKSFSGLVRLWDLDLAEEVGRLRAYEEPTDFEVVLTPNGRHLVSGGAGGAVKVWDLASRKVVASFTADSYISGLTVSPDARSIVAGEGDGNIHILRIEGEL